jgi:para-nitrobenzyl esterase
MRIPTLVLTLCCALLAHAASLVVQTTSGPVQGTTTATSKIWLGIPFAAPPVGNLRWKPPQAPQPWTTVLDASVHGPACPQAASSLYPGNPTSEDCLFIQVYAPLNSNPNSNLPVMFYIFGGGYRSGSPAKYDAQFISGQDYITVVASYRLGALGFIAHPLLKGLNAENTTGNYGIQDQRFAMEWMKNNIAAFGGNPNDVTIAGTSAGAGGVCLHLVAPRSFPYYNKAIMESAASCNGLPLSKTAAYAAGDKFIADLGCTGTDAEKVACIYAAPVSRILAVFTARASPAQDEYELMESPLSLVRKGQFNRVPLLMGNTANESSVNWCGGAPLSEQTFVNTVNTRYPATAPALLATYNTTQFPDPTAAMNSLDSDSSFICPAKSFEDAYSAQVPSTWVFMFNEYPFYASGGVGTRECLGASHTFNLNFMFPSYYGSRTSPMFPDPLWTPAETVLANKMRASWAQFVKNGNPQSPVIGAVWPTYDFEEGYHLNIDLGDWWVGTHFKNDQCPVWGVPSSDTSCEDSVSISQTRTGGWSDGVTNFNQYSVSITTGPKPLYAAELIIRFNVVPFTNGPFGSLVNYWGVTRKANGLFAINDWRFSSGRSVPAYTTLTFGYVSKIDGPAVISVGTAACTANCDVDATLVLSNTWNDGCTYFQQYTVTFTNKGYAKTDSASIQLTLPQGSYPSQAWNLQTSQTQADILASGYVAYTSPLWGLDPSQSSSSAGFVLASHQNNAPIPVLSVSSTTCL